MADLLVELKDIVKSYKGRTVVDHVSMNVKPGEIVGLLGPNGAGKTTTFYSVIGLIRPDEGAVLFKGNDVTQLPMYQRARIGMGYLAQEPSVFRRLSVEDNIMAVLEIQDMTDAERRRRLEELLEEQESVLCGGLGGCRHA